MLHNEIKTSHLLGGIGLCLVAAVVLAYFFAPHLTGTKVIEDEPIIINTGSDTSDPSGINVNVPPLKRNSVSNTPATSSAPADPTPPNMNNCPEIRTVAKNPATQEIRDFSTPCDVPEGWEIIPR